MSLLAVAESWEACAYLALGLMGAVGLLAAVSPRRLPAFGARGQVAIGPRTPATSVRRLVGLALLAGVVLVGYWIARV
jgi:hypothetical protein